MRKYVLKRILISIVILFFVSFIIYGLMRCLPTSYIERMAQQKAMAPGSKSYEEWLAQLEEMYHMNGGIISGFFAWMGEMFTGNFGDSWLYTVPVLQKFNDTVWLSFIMGGIAFILEIIIAIPWACWLPPSSTARRTTPSPFLRWPVSPCLRSSLRPC